MESSKFNVEFTKNFVEKYWKEQIQPNLEEFVRIPNLSKNFDKEWNTNGLLEKAAHFLLEWAKKQQIKGAKFEYIKDADKSPLLLIDVEGTSKDSKTVIMYGHLDKQPHFTGWDEGLGPITPVEKNGKIYGRGVQDDGYAIFASIAAIKICQEQKLDHPRIVILIEGDEESGSKDFPPYLEQIKNKIGEPAVVFCLDSGCFDYNTLWMTTTLRGAVIGTLRVKVTNEGVHSGSAGGIIPSSFRIIRQLLDRIEDSKTGEVHKALHVKIPPLRYEEAYNVAKNIDKDFFQQYPLVQGMVPQTSDFFEAYVNNIWKPSVAYIGADGFPPVNIAGNVLRPETSLRLSIRLPPTKDPEEALQWLKKTLEENPPYGAEVKFENAIGMQGWNAPLNEKYLEQIINNSSKNFYNSDALKMGVGGSIPLMGLLTSLFPKAQFVISGNGGPKSNAHGPNENLDIEYTKKLICCIGQILAETTPHLK